MKKTALVVVLSLGLAACGGGGSKSDSTGPSATPAAVITITNGVASPKSVTVAPGSQVQFVNNDRLSHAMYSDPHPEHTDCPEFDSVGFLSPGQSRQTGNLNTTRTCGFHDHDDPFNAGLKGSVVIR
jgi:plastocyanin